LNSWSVSLRFSFSFSFFAAWASGSAVLSSWFVSLRFSFSFVLLVLRRVAGLRVARGLETAALLPPLLVACCPLRLFLLLRVLRDPLFRAGSCAS
jgi:hypothetical protein